MSDAELRKEVVKLRARNETLLAVLRLVVVLLKISEVSLFRRRVPSADEKSILLRSVERSREALSLRTALRILGLSGFLDVVWTLRTLAATAPRAELDDGESRRPVAKMNTLG